MLTPRQIAQGILQGIRAAGGAATKRELLELVLVSTPIAKSFDDCVAIGRGYVERALASIHGEAIEKRFVSEASIKSGKWKAKEGGATKKGAKGATLYDAVPVKSGAKAEPKDKSAKAKPNHAMADEIDAVAIAASKMTRADYDAAGHGNVMSYDLARSAAMDRGLNLARNVDVDTEPSNVGAALLRMIDDVRVERGGLRQHEWAYKPREIVTGGNQPVTKPSKKAEKKPVTEPVAGNQGGRQKETQKPVDAATKEPWQMTRNAWQRSKKTTFDTAMKFDATKQVAAGNDHEAAVKRAVSEGKPVPPEVLADYPDLKPGNQARQPTGNQGGNHSQILADAVKSPAKPIESKKLAIGNAESLINAHANGQVKLDRDTFSAAVAKLPSDALMTVHRNILERGAANDAERRQQLIEHHFGKGEEAKKPSEMLPGDVAVKLQSGELSVDDMIDMPASVVRDVATHLGVPKEWQSGSTAEIRAYIRGAVQKRTKTPKVTVRKKTRKA